MKKIIIMFGILLLIGCSNFSSDLCETLKHANNNESVNVYMENGVCIRETINYNYVYDIQCTDRFQYAHLIVKSQNEQPELTKELKKYCTITKLR